MSEISIPVTDREELILSVLRDLRNGHVEDATSRFAEEFRFKDRGMGLEFKDKERLGEFFQKTRELYPDSVPQTDTILMSGDHVITEWTLRQFLRSLWCLSMADSRGDSRSRCMGPLSFASRTAGLQTGQITTTV